MKVTGTLPRQAKDIKRKRKRTRRELSQDPFLTGSYAVEYVQGLQRGPDPKYVKIQATLKHYTAYSVEDNRGHDNANISRYDMTDSFLRQYEMGFVQGNASVRETHIRLVF